MTPVSGKLFAKLFERKGWVLKRLNGSHHIFSHPAKNGNNFCSGTQKRRS
jgi:predicted RNA binding protein YcfA (HicA-like mRNA interferase family)